MVIGAWGHTVRGVALDRLVVTTRHWLYRGKPAIDIQPLVGYQINKAVHVEFVF